MAATFDNYSEDGKGDNTTSYSFSHSQGFLGATGFVGVIVASKNGSNNINAPTYNGVTMTLVDGDSRVTAAGCHVRIYGLSGTDLPAPIGSYTVAVSFSAFDGVQNASSIGVMSFKNVKAQAAEAVAHINANATSPLAQNITPLTNNALIVVAYGNQNGAAPSFSTGETNAGDSGPYAGEPFIVTSAYKTVAVPALTSTSLTVSNPEDEVLVLASFAIAPDGGNLIASEI